jgi:hypothetical protein
MSEHELKSSAISDMRLCDAFSVCSEPSEPIAAGKHSRLLCETLRCSRWPSAAVISEKPSSVSACVQRVSAFRKKAPNRRTR